MTERPQKWLFGQQLLPLLIAARKERGLSRQRIADQLGATYIAVASWERGDRVPGADHARAWADMLDVPWPADTEGWFYRATMTPQPCGTRAAFLRHRDHGDPECVPCRDAANAYHRDWQVNARRRQRASG